MPHGSLLQSLRRMLWNPFRISWGSLKNPSESLRSPSGESLRVLQEPFKVPLEVATFRNPLQSLRSPLRKSLRAPQGPYEVH